VLIAFLASRSDVSLV